MIAWTALALVAGFLLPLSCHGRVGDLAYPVIDRALQTQQISIEELEDFMLTFSFDSPPKQLEQFWLHLYITDGWLPDNSTATIEEALEQFLVPEVNARYSHHAIKELDAKVLSQATITSSRRRWRRGLQGVIGSELETQLTVTFRNEPSPDKSEVEGLIADIMNDLDMFLSNLTVLGKGDVELENINRAERRDSGGFSNDDDFIPPTTEAISDGQPSNNDDGLGIAVVMTVVAGAFVVLASLALFSVRSRTRSKQLEQVPSGSLGQVNVFLGDEEDDDIFSFEAALIDSPAVDSASYFDSNASSVSQSIGSENFSTVDSQLSTPNESTRSVFSFLSGQKSEGSSTVVASNARKDVEANRKSAKAAKLSSLLTYSDDEASEDSYDDTDLVAGAVLKAYADASESSSNVSSRDPKQRTKVVGVSRVSIVPEERELRIQESESLSYISDTSESRGPDSYYGAIPPPTSTFDPRWAESTFPVAGKSLPTLAAESHSPHASDVNSPDINEVNLAWNNSEEASENAAKAAAFVLAAKAASPIRGQTQNSSPNMSGTDKASPARGETVNSSPSRGGGKSASSTQDEGKKLSPTRGVIKTASPTKGDVKTLSPQRKETKMASPTKGGFKNFSPRRFLSPNRNQSTSSTAGESPVFSPGGRRKNQNGRRHAKSTSGDGSRNYQYETMQQKDETLASFDAVSLSDSDQSATEDVPQTPRTTEPIPTDEEGGSFFSLSPSVSSSDGESNKKLLNDLVWLEKKIAGASTKNADGTVGDGGTPRNLEQVDSMSFASGDAGDGESLRTASPQDKDLSDAEKPKGVSAIVCRDCFAPPGKLRIVIHSTKDGPAIHTVKTGSSLTGHVFPGDLIISVDDVDTRSFSAEQVMKMMTARNKYQRKITVLHFESENA
jgi:hypothetical protein